MTTYKPLHPGEILRDLLIEGAGLSVTDAAERLGVSRTALSQLLNGHSSISAEMALRLAKLLNTTVAMWVNLQAQYDIWKINLRFKEIKVKPLKLDEDAA